MKTVRLTYCDICGAPGHSRAACPVYRLNEMQEAKAPMRAKAGLLIMGTLALFGCAAQKPVHNQPTGLAIPKDCIQALYIEKPGAQCLPAGRYAVFCKDFAVLTKDIECVKVKQ